MNTFIYTLTDPFTNEIRYVGKSNDPKKRLYDHIRCCHLTNTHKNNWVKSILEKSGKPLLNIIDKVPKNNWQLWETYWISKLKEEGHNLTNISDGGNGMSEHRYNTKEKMKIRHKEFPNYNKCKDKEIIIDKDLLYQKYIIENLSLNKCASFFNTVKSTIFRNLKEYNIKKDKSIWIKQCASHEKKIILQYDLGGNFIKKWIGLKSIEDTMNLNTSVILNCCKGRSNKSYGYIWRFENSNVIREYDISKKSKCVIQIDQSGCIINEFNSIKKASVSTNIQRSAIGYCCRGISKSAGGFIWRYKN